MAAQKTKFHRKSITFLPAPWDELRQIALEKGYRSRNQLIVLTLKKIIEDHRESKSQDVA